jgi:hypothetical protein
MTSPLQAAERIREVRFRFMGHWWDTHRKNTAINQG